METSSGSRASSAEDLLTEIGNDRCMYYDLRPGETCRRPRSCFDCLNAPVPAEPSGCMISSNGWCRSMREYKQTQDFRGSGSASDDSGLVSNLRGGWFQMFPSINTTYCNATDTACTQCHELAVNASREHNFLAETMKYCSGTNGCVCIVGCESPTWSTRFNPDCQSRSPSVMPPPTKIRDLPPAVSTINQEPSKNHRTLLWLLVLVQIPFVLAWIYRRYQRRARENGERVAQPRPRRSTQLQLAGWRSMQEELIKKERERATARPSLQ
ncbi:TPA: hypothetical protein N0F65_009160 [Lagenidium giganteum]|uniref:Uncharacterized protein n=1 Tax=Lagenidium giganteum TaxID=4803 RepID=A0AAV2YSD1_9STRA|nr:TPA: hypothetical protein N0F65_009160 [Lagenidium giganteum]